MSRILLYDVEASASPGTVLASKIGVSAGAAPLPTALGRWERRGSSRYADFRRQDGPGARARLDVVEEYARHQIPDGSPLSDPRDTGGSRRPHAAGRAGAGDLDRHRDRGLEHEVAAPLARPAPPQGREPPRPRRPLAG